MRQWIVDAFAERPFTGNPACVLEPLDDWPGADWMQALAAENNQAETAFLRRTADPSRFDLRWFTPTVEVPLCGHATLASAHVLYAELGFVGERVSFDTLSGPLLVQRTHGGYQMDFPIDRPSRIAAPAGLGAALGVEPLEVWAGRFLIALLAEEAQIRSLCPDLPSIRRLSIDAGGGDLIVAAPADVGSAYDVVDRVFAPGSGIPEDAATGSAHCSLAPLFSDRLGRDRLRFLQAYPRRGAAIGTTIRGERVDLSGDAVTTVEARLRV